jgi:beta-N-acetylglucosaminidase
LDCYTACRFFGAQQAVQVQLERMVSKKKAKGQARKAAKAQKEAKEKDSTSVVNDAAALEAQMQRLSVNNATTTLTSASDRDRSSCNHGFDSTATPDGDACFKFARLVSNKFIDILDKCEAEQQIINPFSVVIDEAFMEEHGEVFEDAAKMELMVSLYASVGTTSVIMDNDIDAICLFAAFAEYFKQLLAVVRETQPCFNHGKIYELYLGKF